RFVEDTPVSLTAWVADQVDGKVFNPMEWGSLLAWRAPKAKLFIDVRIWVFPKDVWEDYREISGAARGWEDRLDARGVQWAILDRRFHAALIPYISDSPRWEKVYEDELGLIFRRKKA